MFACPLSVPLVKLAGPMRRAERLLNEGRYQQAYRAILREAESPVPAQAARALLLLAEFYGLYGEEEREGLEHALSSALEEDPSLAETPLFGALARYAAALRGEEASAFATEDPRAAYWLALAEYYQGRLASALELLSQVRGLPPFLAWRAWDLKGSVLEELGRFFEAHSAYRRALELAPPERRPEIALHAAAAALDAGRAEAAREVLERVGPPADEEGRDAWRELYARAELGLGNPEGALAVLEGGGGFGVELARGRALMELGRYDEAVRAFGRALELAPDERERAFARHDLAVAELELGHLAAAEESLKALAADPDYPHRGVAALDLAELYYRHADLEATERWAEEAIALGQVAGGKLFLGHVAYDRMRLEEALEHYRRTSELAPEGSRDWLVAQQMAVEILAQLGYPDPYEVLSRAEAALRYTPATDDWHGVLELYAARARERIDRGRVLN